MSVVDSATATQIEFKAHPLPEKNRDSDERIRIEDQSSPVAANEPYLRIAEQKRNAERIEMYKVIFTVTT